MLLRAVLAVEGCSNVFSGCFNRVFSWSFSMLSGLAFLTVFSPDCLHYFLVNVDGAKSLD